LRVLYGDHAEEGRVMAPPLFVLYLHFDTGRTSVLAFETRLERALMVVSLSSQPVTFQCVDY
jgi:hypothetical protein